MDFIDWLFFSITVSRRLTNSYYIIMLIISLIAIVLMFRMRFKRFSMYLWLISGLICLLWELYLFVTGARHYNFLPALELPYHALTEAGPGLIIMILFAHKIKIIDITEYSDDHEEEPKPKSTPRGSKRKQIKLAPSTEEPEHEISSAPADEMENDMAEE
jgi:hypothetical protein